MTQFFNDSKRPLKIDIQIFLRMEMIILLHYVLKLAEPLNRILE